MSHPGETARGVPNGTRYLCPLCDWWLDVPPIPLSYQRTGSAYVVTVQNTAAIEGALAGHFATVQHRPPAANQFSPWTAELLEPCRCGHPHGDHFRESSTCMHSTDTETWACDCYEFALR